jgi:ComF family protein
LPGNAGAVCGACQQAPPPWQRTVAALDYRFPVKQLVRRFKFNGSLASGDVLARELSRAVAGSPPPLPELIVPVPLHRWRLFLRNYNQAELLARRAGRDFGIPVASLLLHRNRRTRAQAGLDAKERRRNTRGAFRLGRGQGRRLRDHVALVDDVMTTGATLTECARVLRTAGVSRIQVWVAARAPPPG